MCAMRTLVPPSPAPPPPPQPASAMAPIPSAAKQVFLNAIGPSPSICTDRGFRVRAIHGSVRCGGFHMYPVSCDTNHSLLAPSTPKQNKVGPICQLPWFRIDKDGVFQYIQRGSRPDHDWLAGPIRRTTGM